MVDDKKMYSPGEIERLGLIVDSNLEPSQFTVYSFIRAGKLQAFNASPLSKVPRYQVQGDVLKKFVQDIYQLN